MTIDRTKGKEAKYMVSLYGWNIEDHYIFHTFREAKSVYDTIKAESHNHGTVLSISDMKKDVRKAFTKF